MLKHSNKKYAHKQNNHTHKHPNNIHKYKQPNVHFENMHKYVFSCYVHIK